MLSKMTNAKQEIAGRERYVEVGRLCPSLLAYTSRTIKVSANKLEPEGGDPGRIGGNSW